MMNTLFSSALLLLIKHPLRLILTIAMLHFASLQIAQADTGANPDQLQRSQDASNPLFGRPFEVQSGVSEPAIDSPMNSFEGVPTVNVPVVNGEAKIVEAELHGAAADQVQHLSIAAIPEPSSWVLLSLGIGTLLAFGYILRQHNRTV